MGVTMRARLTPPAPWSSYFRRAIRASHVFLRCQRARSRKRRLLLFLDLRHAAQVVVFDAGEPAGFEDVEDFVIAGVLVPAQDQPNVRLAAAFLPRLALILNHLARQIRLDALARLNDVAFAVALFQHRNADDLVLGV